LIPASFRYTDHLYKLIEFISFLNSKEAPGIFPQTGSAAKDSIFISLCMEVVAGFIK
jgi:hypothetical protein